MNKKTNPAGGITHKKDKNAGSGAFNQGSEQDPDFDKGIKVSDEEKRTGQPPTPGNPPKTSKPGKNKRANTGGKA